jgi:chaperonin cofactor prefoldin
MVATNVEAEAKAISTKIKALWEQEAALKATLKTVRESIREETANLVGVFVPLPLFDQDEEDG